MTDLQQQVGLLQQQVTEAKDETAKMVGMLEAGLDQLQVRCPVSAVPLCSHWAACQVVGPVSQCSVWRVYV